MSSTQRGRSTFAGRHEIVDGIVGRFDGITADGRKEDEDEAIFRGVRANSRDL